jgi:leader peptidase (prepilin peptidase)/N-methyltransferase
MSNLLPIIPLAYFGIRLSIIDFKIHRLPNKLVGWFALTEVLLLVGLSFVESDLRGLVTAIGVALTTMSIYVLLYFISRGALGMGDVKFAFPLGLCIGWYSPEQALISLYISFLAAGFVALIGIISKRMSRRSRLAFGPYMFLSTFLVCIL